jgi:plasmid stabilization system protein ParE
VKLRFLSVAFRDLGDIEKYIAERNPDAARAVVRRILQQINKLKVVPYLGRPGYSWFRDCHMW